jgi:glutathione synthase/RimK-type ligase-like ATP-grasp enzyme
VKRNICMLLDYRSQFYSSVRSRGASFDVDRLREMFERSGYELVVRRFTDVDFRRDDFKDRCVLYQSSEDPHSFYKNYIEDVLLGLQLQGARLIPDFYKFRAHHNKVFMEILRDLSAVAGMKSIRSKGYGTYEDFAGELDRYPDDVVMKPDAGALSAKVVLARTPREKKRHAARLSRTFEWMRLAKNLVNGALGNAHRIKSNHRSKFIVQNFIPGLAGDCKILIYHDKYYVLFRGCRDNDFRASGSGKFAYRREVPSRLLDLAEEVFKSFDVPYLSLDMTLDENQCYLWEFQFLCFGTYTLEKSQFHFQRAEDGQWRLVEEEPDLEREFVRSVVHYIEKTG